MLSDSMTKKLNEQVNLENYSVHLYLQMSFWCLHQGLDGCYSFLRKQSLEEAHHLNKLCEYVNASGAMAELDTIEAPPHSYTSVHDIFIKIHDHEKLITEKIKLLVAYALKEQDFCTFNFLQWFVAEQHEEETLFGGILSKFEVIGKKQENLYILDKYIGRLASSTNN